MARGPKSTLLSPTAAVYVRYDVEQPPPHPGPSWTRFVCISDTHSRIYHVPDGDVLLHSGDLSSGGSLKRLQFTIDWLTTLPHPVKIVIAGNHDLCLDKDRQEGRPWGRFLAGGIPEEDTFAARVLVRSEAMRGAGLRYLQFESTEITTPSGRTWKVYGSPAAPRYSWGAFQYEYEEGEDVYAQIPDGTEILLTHTPPFGILNKTRKGMAAGCKDLAKRLASDGLQQCRLHAFGHIHESHGAVIHEEAPSERVSVNAAVAYCGQAVIVDLKN